MHYLAPVRRRETIGQYHDHHRPFEALLKKKKKKKKKKREEYNGTAVQHKRITAN
jgi:hypothetical protein